MTDKQQGKPQEQGREAYLKADFELIYKARESFGEELTLMRLVNVAKNFASHCKASPTSSIPTEEQKEESAMGLLKEYMELLTFESLIDRTNYNNWHEKVEKLVSSLPTP